MLTLRCFLYAAALVCAIFAWHAHKRAPSSKRIPDLSSTTVMWGIALDGFPIDKERLLPFKKEARHSPDIILFFLQWPQSPSNFTSPIPSFQAIWETGALPCLTWEPMYYHNGKRQTIDYRDLINHHYDPYLEASTKALLDWPHTCILRFAHEMNLSEYHWGTSAADYGSDSPEIYKQMFRYVVDFFRARNVNNVIWAFCPNVDSIPNEPWNNLADYYPGDRYVDLMGLDGYNWDGPASTEPTRFKNLFLNSYHSLKKLSPEKPIFIFETASSVDQESWLKESQQAAKDWQLKGIIWFQVDKERSWSLKHSTLPIFGVAFERPTTA